MKILGVITRPRVYCRECEEVVYVADKPTARPETARRRLRKIHKQSGCKGKIEYAAAVLLRGIPRGM